jgi:hypothetical protein
MSNYTCEFCKKTFSTKANCIRHNKICKSKVVSEKEKKDELIKKMEHENIRKDEEIRQKDELIKKMENEKIEKDEQIQFLKSLLASNKTNNITINNNINIKKIVSKLEPIDFKDMGKYMDKFTSKYIDESLRGIAKFICEYPYKDKFITTDHSRNTIAYRTKELNFIRDPDAFYLLKKTLEENKEDIINKSKVRLSTINKKIKNDDGDQYIDIKNGITHSIDVAENTFTMSIDKDVSDIIKFHGIENSSKKLIENINK